MIITRQKSVPWSWVFLTHLPWAGMLFASAVGSIVMTLELRKFTANPTTISILLAAVGLSWTVVNPIIHFLSDRIWTRFGRRKVFYVPATVAQILAILMIPFATNVWVLFAGFFAYQLMAVISQPKESLAQEVVPNHQRGRASVLHTIFIQIGLFSYNIALIGRFDDVLLDSPLDWIFPYILGEKLIFWVFASALVMVVLIVSLGVKEMKPPHLVTLREELGGRITLWGFFRCLFVAIFSSQWWPIYLLGFSKAMYGLNLGPMVVLMYTEQWGYSTQDLGTNQAITQLFTVLTIGFLIAFIDKFDRLKTYGFIIVAGLLAKTFWYLFVMFIAPEQRPALWQILVIGESIGIIGHLVGTVTYPLLYEYVPVNKVGTANAGLAIFMGLLGFAMGIVKGLWIEKYSEVFHPAAGSEVTVVLEKPVTASEAEAWTREWSRETGDEYYATLYKPGTVRSELSRQWKFRIGQPDADAEKDQVDKANDTLKKIVAAIEYKEAVGDEDALLSLHDDKARLIGEVSRLETGLRERVSAFQRFLEERLRDRLVPAGSALAAVSFDGRTATLEVPVVFSLTSRALASVREEILLNLEDYGWEEIVLDPIGSEENPGLRLTLVAPEGLRGDPKAEESLRSLVESRLGSAAPPGSGVHLAAVLGALTDAVAGFRNSLLVPFPDSSFEKQKYDYFSVYLLMILTDFLALYAVWLLYSREKSGKLVRLGVLEEKLSAQAEKGRAS